MKIKKIFLGLIVIGIMLSMTAKGQILEYKELKEFNGDTTAYIEYTFTTSNHFLHCTMDEPATTSCIAQWTKSLPNAKSLLNPICLPEQPETALAFASCSFKMLKKSGHYSKQANLFGVSTVIFQPYTTTKSLLTSPSIKN